MRLLPGNYLPLRGPKWMEAVGEIPTKMKIHKSARIRLPDTIRKGAQIYFNNSNRKKGVGHERSSRICISVSVDMGPAYGRPQTPGHR